MLRKVHELALLTVLGKQRSRTAQHIHLIELCIPVLILICCGVALVLILDLDLEELLNCLPCRL